MKINFRQSGQSLFEVVVAIGIAALVLMGIVSLAASAVRNSTFSRNNAQATKYAQEAMEWLREQRDSTQWNPPGFRSHASYSPGTPTCLGSSPISAWGGSCNITNDTKFTRNVVLTMSDDATGNPNIIDAVVTVAWSDAQGSHTVTSTTRFTNWQQ